MLFGDFPSMTVHARAAYPSWPPGEHQWRDQDYDANFFAHAIKADRTKLKDRVKNLPIGPNGSRVRVSASNIPAAQSAFCAWAAQQLVTLDLSDVVLLAVPNSNATAEAQDFNIARIARLIAQMSNGRAQASTALRFIEYRPKSERERRPSALELRDNMTVVGAIPDGNIVLVDDVFTQGHHLTAATWSLPVGRDPPSHALVAARTIKQPVADVWNPITEEHFLF